MRIPALFVVSSPLYFARAGNPTKSRHTTHRFYVTEGRGVKSWFRKKSITIADTSFQRSVKWVSRWSPRCADDAMRDLPAVSSWWEVEVKKFRVQNLLRVVASTSKYFPLTIEANTKSVCYHFVSGIPPDVTVSFWVRCDSEVWTR